MSNEQLNFVKKLSSKLGITDMNIIMKAMDLLRILQLKLEMRVSETHKAVLCLDLASTQFGACFDKSKAMQLAAVKKTLYTSTRSYVEKLIQPHSRKTIYEVCVQLGCEHVAQQASSILLMYKAKDQLDRDFTHPQYTVAAVAAACVVKKVQLNSSELVELSNLKPSQWKKLKEEFTKFVQKNNFKAEAATAEERKTQIIDAIDEVIKETEEKSRVVITTKQRTPVKSYEEWRSSILTEAYANISKH